MVDLPGQVPPEFNDDSVGHLRAEERVFDAMLEGWRTQMLARGLSTGYIRNRLRQVRQFQVHTNEFPWTWQPANIEEYLADRASREKPVAQSTLRGDAAAVRGFCDFVVNPAYGWVALCLNTFDEVPIQICFEWNTPRHSTDDDVPPARRAFTILELQQLFTHIDNEVDRAAQSGSKRWLPLLRDSVAFKVAYAFGLRRRELAMLELSDFGPNPHVPDYERFGSLIVRWGKATNGSGPRRRTVLTVPKFDWVVGLMKFWSSPAGRRRFPTADGSGALWPSERSSRISVQALGDSFAAHRDAAGLPAELGLHCLRHSYVTHLIEAGYDPTLVQMQVGHAYASTTSLYTSVSSDFKQKTVQKMIGRRIELTKEPNNARTETNRLPLESSDGNGPAEPMEEH